MRFNDLPSNVKCSCDSSKCSVWVWVEGACIVSIEVAWGVTGMWPVLQATIGAVHLDRAYRVVRVL